MLSPPPSFPILFKSCMCFSLMSRDGDDFWGYLKAQGFGRHFAWRGSLAVCREEPLQNKLPVQDLSQQDGRLPRDWGQWGKCISVERKKLGMNGIHGGHPPEGHLQTTPVCEQSHSQHPKYVRRPQLNLKICCIRIELRTQLLWHID